MVRDTHLIRRSILHKLQQEEVMSTEDIKTSLEGVTLNEVIAGINFLKNARMVNEVEELVELTDSTKSTPIATLYNNLKVGRTYDRKQIGDVIRTNNLPISGHNAVKTLVNHGGLHKKSGNSFKCTELPKLLGVSQEVEVATPSVNEPISVISVSATRRVVWEALDVGKTRSELYSELIAKYPSLNKTQIGGSLSHLLKNGSIDLDRNDPLKTYRQLVYIPFDIDIFYHEVRNQDTITHTDGTKVCKKHGLRTRPGNIINSLIGFGALSYTETKGVFKVEPLPQLEWKSVQSSPVQSSPVQSTNTEVTEQLTKSVNECIFDVEKSRQALEQINAESELKIREVKECRQKRDDLREKARIAYQEAQKLEDKALDIESSYLESIEKARSDFKDSQDQLQTALLEGDYIRG